MNRQRMLLDLLRASNDLDDLGLYKSSQSLDDIITKIAYGNDSSMRGMIEEPDWWGDKTTINHMISYEHFVFNLFKQALAQRMEGKALGGILPEMMELAAEDVWNLPQFYKQIDEKANLLQDELSSIGYPQANLIVDKLNEFINDFLFKQTTEWKDELASHVAYQAFHDVSGDLMQSYADAAFDFD